MLVGLDGVVRAGTDVAFEVPADSATQIVLPAEVTSPREPSSEVLVVSVGDVRGFWLWDEIGDIEWPGYNQRSVWRRPRATGSR